MAKPGEMGCGIEVGVGGGLSLRVWGRIYLVCFGGNGGHGGESGAECGEASANAPPHNNFPRQSLVVTGAWAAYSWRLFPFSPLSSDRAPRGLFGPGLAVVRFACSPKRGPGIPAVTAGAAASNSGISLASSVPFCAEKKSDQLLNAILIMFKISLFGLIGLYLVARLAVFPNPSSKTPKL